MRSIQEIETFLDEKRVEHDIPGLSVTLFDTKGLIHTAGLGARDIASRSPATPNTRYSIASVTKTFTAIATLQLANTGALSLSDEIRRYVDYWNDVPGEPITVEDVLTHSHRMPSAYIGEREHLFAETPPTSPVITGDDYARHVNAAADRRFPPADDRGYLYSGFGYLVLGEIIEAVIDQPYGDYVEAEIFAPLGMEDAQVGYGELAEIEGDTVTGYRIEDGEPVPNSHNLKEVIRAPYSGGGILCSMTDLARLGRCLLNDGELEQTRVIPEHLAKEMSRQQAPTWDSIDGTESGYGYGLQIKELLGERVAAHTGTAPGISRGYLGVLPESGLGATLGVNTTEVPIGGIGEGVLAMLKGESPTESVPMLSLQEKLSTVTGIYKGFRGAMKTSVEACGTHIRVSTAEDSPGFDFPAFPENSAHNDYRFYTIRSGTTRLPVTFHERDGKMELHFGVDRLERIAQ